MKLTKYVLVWPLAMTCGLAACAGTEAPIPIEPEPVEEPEEVDPTAYPADGAAGPVSLRKLSREQLVRSIHDLLGPEVSVPETGEPDAVLAGLASVGAGSTSYSPRGVEGFEAAAYAVAAQATGDEAVRARLVPCTPAGSVDAACAEATLRPLARRAFRRPVADEEVAALVAVAGEAGETLGDFYAGIEFGVAAVLQSPSFLYRVEIGRVDPETGERTFTDHELATRLSFFLWNTTPDDELLAAADQGLLSTDEGLTAQAERLLESERARDGLRRFFDEWLRLEDLEALSKDPTQFDFYTNELGPSARQETLLLLDWLVFEADQDIRTLMTTTTTFVNPLLAALYDVPSPTLDDEFGRIQLPADGPRAGLLGHASFLNLHAHPVSTSVTRRGKAVRNILLCQTMPDPPVDVDTSIPQPSGTAPTMRDRVAEHLQNESCATCHLLMDPIGLGLEQFDGVGRFRTLDHGALIDASGDLDGDTYQTPRELGQLIGSHPAFVPCFVRTLTRYALGRTIPKGEFGALKALTERFRRQGHRVVPLILELVRSPLFREAGAPEEGDVQ